VDLPRTRTASPSPPIRRLRIAVAETYFVYNKTSPCAIHQRRSDGLSFGSAAPR
jgi:hypothetical protein